LGLARSDAILATNFTGAMPADAGKLSSSAVSERIRRAICAAGPNRPTDAVTSRKASSSDSASTRGV
jgi:hypothetical protein